MQTTSFKVDERHYNISYEKIVREETLFIYSGSIHLPKPVEFSCMKVDGNTIFITSPVTLPDFVESAILQAITHSENSNNLSAIGSA